jgi:AAA domain/Helix-turn-helix domain of resolvase
MKALEFIKSLKGTPAFLRVEAQPSGGCLSQCPSCAPCPSVGLSLAFNQIGEDLVVRCYGGCSDEDLVDGLYLPADGVEVITANQWRDRERERGHSYEYLQEKLSKALPLPEALRPPAAPLIPSARTFDELLSLKVAPRVELCGPWLKEGTLTEVYGWRGAGKSWFGLSLAFAVAAGVDFMRWGVTEARGVLYVDGEMGLDDIQARIPRIHQSEQKRAGRPLHPKLRYIADSDMELFPNGLPKLSTKEGKALVEANLEGISLVVLDNLSTLYNSAIENDAESWVEAQDWLLSLRRRGLAVVFVHHAGKGGQQRGTSKREDICDTVIALKKPETHQAEDGCAFTLAFEKNRGVHGPSVASFSAKLTEDEDGDLIWVLQESKEERGAQIKALFEQGMPIRQIAKSVGLSHSNVSRYLSKNKASGEVVRGAPPRRGGAHHPTTPAHQEERTSAPPAHHFSDMPQQQRFSEDERRTTPRTTPAPITPLQVVRPPIKSAPPAHQEERTSAPGNPTRPGTYRITEDSTTKREEGPLSKTYFNGVATTRQRPQKE